jgi:hypothetical protein
VKSLLFQKPVIVKNAVIDHALVNVSRNKDGAINLNQLQQGPIVPPPTGSTEPIPEPGKVPPEQIPTPGTPAPSPEAPKPWPEVLLERVLCDATIRYVDFKLNDFDIALKLNVKAAGISTLSADDAAWGAAAITGALGDDHNSYVTDLNLRLAPVRNLETWSFDLTGRVMEIDPRSLQSMYDRMGIRTDPFGLEPQFYCRDNRFMNSEVSITLKNIQFEEKLSRQLGNMGTVESLRVTAPIEGTLDRPVVDLQAALMKSISGNAGSLLNAWIRGQAAKQAGMENTPESITDAAVEALANEVPEIAASPTAKKVLKDLADGKPSATNQPAPISSDTVIDLLGEQVDEIGENEELKNELKNLGKWLFGE